MLLYLYPGVSWVFQALMIVNFVLFVCVYNIHIYKKILCLKYSELLGALIQSKICTVFFVLLKLVSSPSTKSLTHITLYDKKYFTHLHVPFEYAAHKWLVNTFTTNILQKSVSQWKSLSLLMFFIKTFQKVYIYIYVYVYVWFISTWRNIALYRYIV